MSNKVDEQANFYGYQQKRTRILLFWGLGSVLSGAVGWRRAKNETTRQFWLQCLLWGAIDAVIAEFGLRGTRKKLLNPPPAPQINKDTLTFRRILLINAGLDVTYILSGLVISQRPAFQLKPFKLKKEVRQGMGAGFVVQGLFLFGFDSWLASEVKRRWLK